MSFIFNGQHASQFGLVVRSMDRSLLPPLRSRQLEIPGRHGAYDFGENKYENRIINLNCFLKAKTLQELRQKSRIVAAWLKDKGQLMFDDEPDKYYMARIYNQVGIEQSAGFNGEFQIDFECEPFAYSETNTMEVTRTDDTSFFIFNNGTVDTPAEYTITNTGASTVTNITIKIIKKI